MELVDWGRNTWKIPGWGVERPPIGSAGTGTASASVPAKQQQGIFLLFSAHKLDLLKKIQVGVKKIFTQSKKKQTKIKKMQMSCTTNACVADKYSYQNNVEEVKLGESSSFDLSQLTSRKSHFLFLSQQDQVKHDQPQSLLFFHI